MTTAAFVGRETELAALDRVLAGAAQGQLTMGLVEGEPGIGKTRLLREAIRGREQFRVFPARAEEIDIDRPFGLVQDAISSGGLALPPGFDHSEAADFGSLHRRIESIIDLLETSSLLQPLALVLDDLQWADQASLMTLRTVVRRLAALPIGLLCAFRPNLQSPELRQLIASCRASGSTHVRLGPLAPIWVEELIRAMLQAEPHEEIITQAGRATGNPLFVTELIRALRDEGIIETRDGRAVLRNHSLPPPLRLTLIGRLGLLPSETIEALRIAAILGSTFAPGDVATVLRRDLIETVRSLQAALDAQIIESAGETLRFRHDLIREAVYEDMPLAVREALHLEAARRLAAQGKDPLGIARHFSVAAEAGDEQAITWLRRAAAEARTVPASAEALLRRAIELAGPSHPERPSMALELAGLLHLSARSSEAEDLLRGTIATTLPPDLDGQAQLLLAQVLFAQGRWSDEVSAIEHAMNRPIPSVDRARLLAEAVLARLWLGDLDRAWDDGQEAIGIARAVGDDVAESLALGHLAGVAGGKGELVRCVELARQAVSTAHSEEAQARHPHLALAVTALDVDDFAGSEEATRAGLALAERTGAAWAIPMYQTWRAMRGYYTGQWEDAVVDAEAGLSLGEETGTHPVAFAAHCIMTMIAVHRGEIEAAQNSLERATAILASSGPQFAMWWHARARALLAEARGDIDEAFEGLAADWRIFAERGIAHSQLFIGPDLARLSAHLDSRMGEEVADKLQSIASISDVESVRGAYLYARGLVRRDPEILGRSVAAYERSRRLRELGVSLEAYAIIADGPKSRDAFMKATSAYEKLGAQRDLARTVSAMRSRGIRRGTRGSRARSEVGWDSLTASEVEVVKLAMQGLTNPQIAERLFISRYTVATHLAHVYAKLGLSSRVELATAATRQGLAH